MKNYTLTPITSFKHCIWIFKNRIFNATLSLCILLLIGSLQVTAQNNMPTKIGVVDLDAVVEYSNAGKALQQKLGKFNEEYQIVIEGMNNEANEIKNKVANGSSFSNNELVKLSEQYDSKLQDMNRYKERKEREYQNLHSEGMRQIETLIQPKLNILMQQEGIDLLLNSTPGYVLMATENVNLTRQLIALLNE